MGCQALGKWIALWFDVLQLQKAVQIVLEKEAEPTLAGSRSVFKHVSTKMLKLDLLGAS